jgi:hypothetical protein
MTNNRRAYMKRTFFALLKKTRKEALHRNCFEADRVELFRCTLSRCAGG